MDEKKTIEELNIEIEALKEQLEEAKAANTAKEVFLSNMSHDIRTPMNAIVGMTALAKKHIDEKPRVVDALNKIETASGHLLSLINDVLDMSRINSGKLKIAADRFNLSDLLHDTLTIIQPQMNAKGHDYEFLTDNIVEEDFFGDPLRIRQVLVNIIGNAIKYTNDGGHLVLKVSETVEGDICRLRFSCRDNGIGMTKEFLERIFDPFERVNSSTISGIEGTGLGMSIVKKTIEAMRGDIEIDSTPGEGTEVRISIPLLCDRAPVPYDELKGRHLLIIEADESTRKGYDICLEGRGVEYDMVSGVQEAFSSMADADFKGFEYDGVIIGKSIDGDASIFDIASYLKKSYQGIVIILASDVIWSDIELRAQKSGIEYFIPVPFFKKSLLRGLNTAFKGREEDQAGDLDLNGKNLLLVEDNLINREIAKEILSVTGANIETADDGAQAVDKFTSSGEGYYSLILMDIQMPVMNGYEAARTIRALDRKDAAAIPIFAMTANTFAEDIAKAKEAGMDGHIAKPVDINALLRTIGQALR